MNHPSELVAISDKVEVMVLGINEDKQEISLGMKQTQPNPWDEVTAKYPPGTMVKGTVRNLTNYGAFVELQEGVDGLLHISDMSWTRKVSHANEILKKGDPIECQILTVDEDRRRIALGLKQLGEDPWETRIPEKYAPGKTVTGKVTKITNFGVFVQLEDDLEGLLHVSELADHKVDHPENMVQVGQDLEVRILRVDTGERKIGLSRKTEAKETEAATATTGEEVQQHQSQNHAKNLRVEWVPVPARCSHLGVATRQRLKKLDRKHHLAAIQRISLVGQIRRAATSSAVPGFAPDGCFLQGLLTVPYLLPVPP